MQCRSHVGWCMASCMCCRAVLGLMLWLVSWCSGCGLSFIAGYKRDVFNIKLDLFWTGLCAKSLRCTCTVMHTGFRLVWKPRKFCCHMWCILSCAGFVCFGRWQSENQGLLYIGSCCCWLWYWWYYKHTLGGYWGLWQRSRSRSKQCLLRPTDAMGGNSQLHSQSPQSAGNSGQRYQHQGMTNQVDRWYLAVVYTIRIWFMCILILLFGMSKHRLRCTAMQQMWCAFSGSRVSIV